MSNALISSQEAGLSVPIIPVTPDGLSLALEALPATARGWVNAQGFTGASGKHCLVPGSDGYPVAVLYGLGEGAPVGFSFAHLQGVLPAGTYRIEGTLPGGNTLPVLAFALNAYRFTRYKSAKDDKVLLVLPDDIDADDVRRQAEAVAITRDLVNTPANDLGPEELEEAVRDLGARHGASVTAIIGEALLADNFPLIHAVGAASPRAPRLIELSWGNEDAPKVTLVGKGIVFDTGGLDIKPSSAMLLMKKDMGGAANVLGLAHLIMDAKLPVRLKVLIPAAENAIAGNAFRPGDIFAARNGLSVEIGNTDAEGRLVLADALALADEEEPDILIDMATLTGAARVALGPDLPALFTPDDAFAETLRLAGEAEDDPLWRLPLWARYDEWLAGKISDLNNAPAGGYAGAITAALFLKRFVAKARAYAHIDLFAWNPTARPGRPEGGEAMTIRALYHVLKSRFPAS